jgi:hypothetical protein
MLFHCDVREQLPMSAQACICVHQRRLSIVISRSLTACATAGYGGWCFCWAAATGAAQSGLRHSPPGCLRSAVHQYLHRLHVAKACRAHGRRSTLGAEVTRNRNSLKAIVPLVGHLQRVGVTPTAV